MRKIIIALSVVLCLTVLVIVAAIGVMKNNGKEDETLQTSEQKYVTPMKDVVDVNKNAIDNFDDDSMEKLSEFTVNTSLKVMNNEKNICYSPISMYAALANTAELAGGESRKELLNVLCVDDMDMLEGNYKKYKKDLNYNISDISISLNNSVWVSDKYKLSENAQETFDKCKNSFGTDVYNKDFNKKDIDKWISEKTKGLIEKANLSVSDKFVIMSALYYNSAWTEKFSIEGIGDFWNESGEKTEVQYMTRELSSSRYIKGDNYIAVGISLYGENMFFICPDEGYKLENLLNEETMSEIMASIQKVGFSKEEQTNGKIRVPLFEIKSELSDVDIFGENLFEQMDWSNTSDELSKINFTVKQQTFLSVDEEGIEGAAVSTGNNAISVSPETTIELSLDKPFMYLLEREGIPLFMGTVYNPAE